MTPQEIRDLTKIVVERYALAQNIELMRDCIATRQVLKFYPPFESAYDAVYCALSLALDSPKTEIALATPKLPKGEKEKK